jgi:hypothetical protein
VIGRLIDVHAGLEVVTGHCDGVLVASHRRSWARRQTISDPAHVATAARMRADYQHAGAGGGDAGRDDGQTGLVRNLADYDARFGIDFTIDGPAATEFDVAGYAGQVAV